MSENLTIMKNGRISILSFFVETVNLREDAHQWADERYLVKYIPVEHFSDEIVTKLKE